MDTALERYWIPKGTTIHLNGIPVEIEQETVVKTTKENWALIKEQAQFPPSLGEPKADNG